MKLKQLNECLDKALNIIISLEQYASEETATLNKKHLEMNGFKNVFIRINNKNEMRARKFILLKLAPSLISSYLFF